MGSGDPERSSAGADARGLDSVAPNDATTKVGDPSARWVEGRLRRDDDHLLDGPILVGRYVVLDRLGQGAMGEVMLAYDPKLLREVALKLVFAAGGDASARMLREAQALAQLNHPNVVGIYDVGEHEGSVFMAMEYVRGRTLRQWLEQAPRSWREVVAVLRQAGRGLAAAHRAGLVHRDVKPDNILVADDGRVCVADFGLARADAMVAEASGSGEIASHSDPELAVPLTQTGTVLGTLAYMAPEQHQGAVADAAVDQYALCVTAYEALLGRRPFGARDLLASKLAGPPAPPGDAAVPRVIVRAVLRGLAPKPADRWPSIEALLVQLDRDPRRARIRAALGATAVATVAGALGARELDRRRTVAACEAEGEAITQLWSDDARARVREGLAAAPTRVASETAQRVMPWLDDYAARWAEARSESCLDGRLRGTISADLLERAQWCFDDRRNELEGFATELARADAEVVHLAVAAAVALGPIAHCRDVAVLQRLPAPPVDQREAVREIRRGLSQAWALTQAGRFEPSLAAARQAHEAAQALGWPPLVAAAAYRVAVGLSRTGELAQAEREAEAAFVAASASGSWDVAVDAADQLVWTVGVQLGRHEDGLRWSRLRELAVANLGDLDDVREARHDHRVAFVHFAMGDHARARELNERALPVLEQRLGAEHPDVAAVLFALASSHQSVGEYDAAKALHARALEIRERALGPDHPDVGQSLIGLAALDSTLGDNDAARVRLDRALALFEGTHGREHPATALALLQLGNLDATVGDFVRARQRFEESVAILERTAGPRTTDVAKGLRALANIHAITGDLAGAKQLHARALAVSESLLGRDHVDTAVHLDDLANVEGMLGDVAQSTALHERALAIVEASLGPDNPRVIMILDNLAVDYSLTERRADARRLLERAMALKQRLFAPDHPTVAWSLTGLGELDLAEGQFAAAEDHFQRALDIQSRHQSPTREVAGARFKLAMAQWPRDRQLALATAAAALAELTPQTPGAEPLRSEITAWLAEHRRGA